MQFKIVRVCVCVKLDWRKPEIRHWKTFAHDNLGLMCKNRRATQEQRIQIISVMFTANEPKKFDPQERHSVCASVLCVCRIYTLPRQEIFTRRTEYAIDELWRLAWTEELSSTYMRYPWLHESYSQVKSDAYEIAAGGKTKEMAINFFFLSMVERDMATDNSNRVQKKHKSRSQGTLVVR